MKQQISIFWFRRDLRLNDNKGLYEALNSGNEILPIFIFDKKILDDLDESDRRVSFIFDEINKINRELHKKKRSLHVYYGNPVDVFKNLIDSYSITSVFTNRDYEPYARQRDKEIYELLKKENINLLHFKDQVIFDRNEILKDDGKPYTVYTPYSKQWKKVFTDQDIQAAKSEEHLLNIVRIDPPAFPILKEMGFKKVEYQVPPAEWDIDIIDGYKKNRDFPDRKGTSRLSVHLRFGTISLRQLIRETKEHSETFLNELIWREFFMMILWHYPEVVTQSFQRKYDQINWRNNEKEFDRWKNGKTGFPIVDAGMRELNQTGYMHNRVRMITASFLVKDLLIDWRWGEAYFAEKLMDYELSSNNGGWQWSAGTGCDAAPYFRVFNPDLQAEKFDPDKKYIKKWVPEFNSLEYQNSRLLDHKEARKRTLEAFKAVNE